MPLLVALFILVPLAELYVIIKVGATIGAGWTVLILIADSLLGAYLLKHQGRAAWRRFNDATAAGRVPHREVTDGVMIVFGGALLLTPGFITDIFGIALLLPPTRALLRRAFAGFLIRRNPYGRAAWYGSRTAGRVRGRRRPAPGGQAGQPAPYEPAARRPYDVEGTAEPVEGGQT
jgi:UPF0716 protein FxsA